MGHEIYKNDKQQGREMAWHGLTEVKLDLSLGDCWLKEWDYKAQSVKLDSGEKLPFDVLRVTDNALALDDKGDEVAGVPLTIGLPYNRGTFKPVTNARLVELLEKATEGKDLSLASCGTVKNRGRQFFSFQMGESYRAAGRDFVPYFNVGNGNDKSSPVWQNTSSTATVCNNTFQGNMLDAGLIMEVKKTKFSEIKLGDFSRATKAMLAGQQEFASMLDSLALIQIDENATREFFAGFIGKPKTPLGTRGENIVDRLVALFKSGAGNEGKNLADVFQAVTDYYTHEAASAQGDAGANWKNFVSSEFGAGRDAKQKAWVALNVESTRNGLIALGREVLKFTEQFKLQIAK